MSKQQNFSRLNRFARSLENPLYLTKRFPWLYWKIYNFSWDRWFWLLDNPVAKASLLASLVGYLIFLNDFFTKNFGFEFITNEANSALGLDVRTKLIFIYFGLVLIAMARGVFLFRRPLTIRNGPSLSSWVKFGLSDYTYNDFQRLHGDIRQHNHRTLYGKYYDDDWEAFVEDAIWSQSGRTEKMNTDEKRKSRQIVSYTLAKQTHEDLLKNILIDRYYEYSAKRKLSLALALLLAIPGYALFALPNIDLFLTLIFSF